MRWKILRKRLSVYAVLFMGCVINSHTAAANSLSAHSSASPAEQSEIPSFHFHDGCGNEWSHRFWDTCGGCEPLRKSLFDRQCDERDRRAEIFVTPRNPVIGASQTQLFSVEGVQAMSELVWLVNGIAGGNASVGTIDSFGNYTAPALTENGEVRVSVETKRGREQSEFDLVTIIAPGQIAPTNNPQVARYTITPLVGAKVHIEFGLDSTYGFTTWDRPAQSAGSPVDVLVAGMRANTTYHMRAFFKLPNGGEFDDVDHTFTTGAISAAILPTLTTITTPGQTPQSGVELLDLLNFNTTEIHPAIVTDLSGNVLWEYDPGIPGLIPNPIKLMPNGNFMINYFNGAATDSILQEVDLSGQVVWQMTQAQLNQALAAATCAGCNITIQGTHHDFTMLPNGHLIVLATQYVVQYNTASYPGQYIAFIGDVLIDLDRERKPVWLWSTFDHLDINRAPFGADWTHSNAVVYSPDDKALILSMRNQSMILKIDYHDGKGSGKIIWKLGYQGDFTLKGGTDPQDWFSAQHDMNIASHNSSGVFQLLLFDNGDQRVLDSAGDICGTTVPCASRATLLQLDEKAKTATIEWVDELAPVYAFFGGSNRLLQNGNIEFDVCALTPAADSASVSEVTKTSPPQTVWQMQIAGDAAYRAFRIPSLYPGVQW